MKTCVIRQPAGLGDILFTYKIAKKVIENKKADIVYWPVNPLYECINQYLRDDKIIFVSENLDFPYKAEYIQDTHTVVNNTDLLYIPLQRADRIVPYNNITYNHPMYCKYELVGLDFSDWCDFVNITRNYSRELELKNYLNIADQKFTIVNKTFGTPPDTLKAKSVPDFINCIEIQNLDFDNPFDWCEVFENATEVHTVDTSFCYILAALNKKNVTVYSRNTVTDFGYLKKIFSPYWKYVSP